MWLIFQLIKSTVSQQRQTSPELARKSQPAHCHSAGRDIFGWPALLSVGRDLETEAEIRMLFHVVLTLRNTACINIFMSQATERDWVYVAYLQSAHRACAGHAWGRLHIAGSGSCCSVRLLLWWRPASGSASPHPPARGQDKNTHRETTQVKIKESKSKSWRHVNAHLVWLTRDSLAHWKTKHTYWPGPDSDWSRQMNPKWSDCLTPCIKFKTNRKLE